MTFKHKIETQEDFCSMVIDLAMWLRLCSTCSVSISLRSITGKYSPNFVKNKPAVMIMWLYMCCISVQCSSTVR